MRQTEEEAWATRTHILLAALDSLPEKVYKRRDTSRAAPQRE